MSILWEFCGASIESKKQSAPHRIAPPPLIILCATHNKLVFSGEEKFPVPAQGILVLLQSTLIFSVNGTWRRDGPTETNADRKCALGNRLKIRVDCSSLGSSLQLYGWASDSAPNYSQRLTGRAINPLLSASNEMCQSSIGFIENKLARNRQLIGKSLEFRRGGARAKDIFSIIPKWFDNLFSCARNGIK